MHKSVKPGYLSPPLFSCLIAGGLLLAGCDDNQPLTPQRYQGSDQLFEKIDANIARNDEWRKVVEIDHSRLGDEAGGQMPPARVLIFSNAALETEIIRENPLAALELPLRILAYEEILGGESRLIYKRYAYLRSRYNLSADSPTSKAYQATMAQALEGIATEQVATFPNSSMQPDGIVSIESPYEFSVTLQKIRQAIAAQDDTVTFGEVDFQQNAKALGIDLQPSTMILFGAPAPGANAMKEAPTLGLDAFCQKLLVWQDESGKVYLSFNDLLALAENHGVDKSIALRVIDYRLGNVFRAALE